MVISVSACGHSIPSRVGGNQKWNGAEPALSSKAADNGPENVWIFIIIITAEIRSTVDPSAWIRKYFKAASEEYWLFFIKIKGINESKLSSSPIQAPNQEFAETEIRMPSTKVVMNK